MEIKLIDFTGSGHKDPARYAASVLLFTKSTRLEMKPSLFEEIQGWSGERLDAELAYVARTIPSSWEFVHYTFLISGVTRAFSHQLVRTRTASYAMQTQLISDLGEFDYSHAPELPDKGKAVFDDAVAYIRHSYRTLVRDLGVPPSGARGILPTNIHTNLCMTANLRTFVDLSVTRGSPRALGEFNEFINLMNSEILAVHPWAGHFLLRDRSGINLELNDKLSEVCPDEKSRLDILKLVDELLRRPKDA